MLAQVYLLLLTRLPILRIHLINALTFNWYMCYQMIHQLFWVSVWQLLTIHVLSLSMNLENIKAEINWSSLLNCDLNYYYNVIYQPPSLFAHIKSRYHAFKSKVLKDSHCETAQFWARCMDIIQMVMTLIRATRKQLEVFFSSDYLWVMSPFLCFIMEC